MSKGNKKVKKTLLFVVLAAMVAVALFLLYNAKKEADSDGQTAAKATGCNKPAPRGEVFFGLHMAVSLKVFLVDRCFAIGLNEQHFVRVFAAFVDRAIHAR